MTSKEALEILRECANGEKKLLLFTDSLDLANIIKQDLERLKHYDSIKSELGIFELYREDLNYICNLLNTHFIDSEEWNDIAFKFQSIIGAINCCQLQQGAYERLEKENRVIKNSILGTTQFEWINENHKLTQENEKLKKAIENEIELLIERRFNAYACDDYETHNILNTIIEELREVLGE